MIISQQISTVDSNKNLIAPKHVAIIMDGNRRWALQKSKNPSFGHERGADIVECIVERAIQYNISILTLFAFSTENWKRSRFEVEILFSIFENQLNKMKESMQKNGVRLKVIGDTSKLPPSLKDLIFSIQKLTADNQVIELVLALNYGSRDELCRAVKRLAFDCKNGGIQPEEISESLLESYLDTRGMVDPDLIIRTSGEQRLSNFLLWQAAFAELYITKAFWPDFSVSEFDSAILEYSKRQRRRGV